jgi:hypothetical protein
LVIRPEVAALVDRAELAEVSWENVAVLEKAHLGLVTYPTYKRMTPAERNRVGCMNQTTARQKLGIR